jgi:protein-S-isoprenylcysteine O-methyltransferase Ste14
MTTATAVSSANVTPWRHVRAIALLPFMNTVVIPSVLLALWPAPTGAPMSGVTALAMVAGALLLCAGVALVVHSIRLFVRFGHGTLAPWDPTQLLVNAGAYRFTRNPMKGGLFLVLLGETLLLRSPALAAWLACFAIVNVVYIRVAEEPGLLGRFGASYRDYCARVPRWWPSLRTLYRSIAKERT